MQDLYAELGPLTDELEGIDREKDAAVAAAAAPFLARRAAVQAKIDAVAAKILGSKTAVRAAEVKVDGGPRVVVHEPKPESVPHVPARRIKLLKLLTRNPDAEFGDLTIAMYGRDDRSARGALSAEFSNMKHGKLVVPVTNVKGKFKLTELARRALAQEENASAAQ